MAELFNYRKKPQIYVYSVPNQPGVKVGDTSRRTKSDRDVDAVVARIEEGLVNTPNKQYKLEYFTESITSDGAYFRDHAIHKILLNRGVRRLASTAHRRGPDLRLRNPGHAPEASWRAWFRQTRSASTYCMGIKFT